MNKYVLPSAAVFLILVIALSSFVPVAALPRRITVAPYLEVITIPEDDQLRQTGIMMLGLGPKGDATHTSVDLIAQFKIRITINGELVPISGLPSVGPVCNVAEKDKDYVSQPVTTGKTVITYRQFPAENIKTVVKDVGQYFECKWRWKEGQSYAVGVLDVYFTGPLVADFIADHILVVHVTWRPTPTSATVYYGTDIQDICILGWSFDTDLFRITKATGDYHDIIPDPLTGWAGCESAALYQRSFFFTPF